MNYDEDENLLFKHKATLNNKEGEIVATSKRLAWIPVESTDVSVEMAWANVGTIKYTPLDDHKERVWIMVPSVAGGSSSDAKTFKLTGSTLQSRRMELERFKNITKDTRKGPSVTGNKAPPTTAITTTSNTATSSTACTASLAGKKRSRIQQTLDRNSEEQRNVDTIAQQRKSLLTADRALWKQYHEMVEVSKLFTEEEFWENRNMQYNLLQSNVAVKGKLSVMLMEGMADSKTSGDGTVTVNLTPEVKAQIFSMYPAVRRAFETEVPLHKSEKDFWTAYYQSEYYGRDKGSAPGTNVSFGRTDDMFSRYEESSTNMTNDHSSSSNSNGSGDIRGNDTQVIKVRNLRGLVNEDVDLTAIIGDYGPKDARSTVEDPGTQGLDSTKAQAVIAKYNRFSNSIAAHDSSQSSSSSSSSAIRTTDETNRKRQKDDPLSELHKDVPPAYIPLRLDGVGKGDHHHRHHSSETAESKEGMNEGAFAKSAFAVKKSLRAPPPPIPNAGDRIPLDALLLSRTCLYQYTKLVSTLYIHPTYTNPNLQLYTLSNLFTTDEIVSQMHHMLFSSPATARASSFFHMDMNNFDNVTEAARQAAHMTREHGGGGSGGGVGSSGNDNVSGEKGGDGGTKTNNTSVIASAMNVNSVAGIESKLLVGQHHKTGGNVGTGGAGAPGVIDLTEEKTRDGSSKGKESSDTSIVKEGMEMSEEFRQDTLEMFIMVTEFARHFYGLMGNQPTPGTPAADKIGNIVTKLNGYQESLNTKRAILQNQQSSTVRTALRKKLSASIAVIDEIQKLISRVEMRWQHYQA